MRVTGQDQKPLEEVLVADRENFEDGPPHELFKRLRGECPVHWSPRITEFPEGGRLLVGHDRRRRPRGQPRLADLLL